MKRYLFLLAWVENSEGAGGDLTRVHSQSDLLPEYEKGNEYVFALRVDAPTAEIAGMAGYASSFHENYTGYDTVSTYMEIDGVIVPDNDSTPLVQVSL